MPNRVSSHYRAAQSTSWLGRIHPRNRAADWRIDTSSPYWVASDPQGEVRHAEEINLSSLFPKVDYLERTRTSSLLPRAPLEPTECIVPSNVCRGSRACPPTSVPRTLLHMTRDTSHDSKRYKGSMLLSCCCGKPSERQCVLMSLKKIVGCRRELQLPQGVELGC
jgi:hypothetical protein